MSNNFFGKLNTLVKAHINDIISPIDETISKSRKKALSRHEIRGGLEKDVTTLRKRIDEALVYEDELQKKIDALYQEIATLDAKADALVTEGRESEARTAINRLQQAQREITMLEADIREHHYITQELISQTNMLEGVVMQSKQEAAESGESTEEKSDIEKMGENIVKQLDTTRQKLTDLISNYTRPDETPVKEEYKPEQRRYRTIDNVVDEVPQPKPQQAPSPSHPVKRADVDKDLESRVSRLSKPPSKDEKK